MRILEIGVNSGTRSGRLLFSNSNRHAQMWWFASIVVALLAFLTVPTSVALADECASLARQIRSSGGGGSSPESAQLRRQLVAIQALERRRQCSTKSTGGFFNPCADLARMREDVLRQMAGSGGRRSVSVLQARYTALGCAPERRERVREASGPMSIGGASMLYCVRPSDGYFFPAPKSQFAKDVELQETVDQCRFICDDQGMEVFALTDPRLETEEMISVAERKPYKDLQTAFRYRDDPAFKSCDLRRYYSRVNEMRARTVTPANMANAIIPLPTEKPERQLPITASVEPIKTLEPMALMEQPAPAGKSVRSVGPAFLPDP